MPDMRRRIRLNRTGKLRSKSKTSVDSDGLNESNTDVMLPSEDPEGLPTAPEGDEEDEAPKKQSAKDRNRLKKVHESSILEFRAIQSVAREEREQCLRARRFVFIPGAQWEKDKGQFKNRPQLEFNMTAQAVEQIMIDYRENRIDASFIKKDGALDEDLADTCAAVYRSDRQDSSAEEAFSNGFEEMVTGGMGAWRLKTRFEDDENDEEDGPQRICIEPIYEADRFVYFDLNAREHDKSDATVCYVITPLTRTEYERRYPEDDPGSWPEEVHHQEFDWAPPDVVYLAEKFEVEFVPDMKCVYTPPTVPGMQASSDGDLDYYKSDLEKRPEIRNRLLALGWKELPHRKVKRKRVHKYLLNGERVLRDYGYIHGREIPIIPVYGKRFYIDNKERIQGHAHRAMDPQRLKNMIVSMLADFTGQATLEKPILTPEQIGEFKAIWAGDNLERNPYLPINPVTNADGQKEPMGPVGYTKASVVPPVVTALQDQVDVGMERILGNPNSGREVVSHTTAKGIQAVQKHNDVKSSLFLSNMGKAMHRTGVVWLGMAPEVYSQPGRKIKGVTPLNEPRRIEIMKPMMRDDDESAAATGGLIFANDLTRAKFDVTVDIGPSSESKRDAAFDAGVNMLAVVPDTDAESKQVLTLHNMMNMRGEGSNYLRKYARRKLVQMGVVPPTPEEQKQMEEAAKNAQPSPIEQLALAQAKEAMAKVEEMGAKIQLIMAQVGKTQAETAETVAGIGTSQETARVNNAKTVIDSHKTVADADLAHKQAQADAAKSLHDMRMAEVAAQQPSSGEKGSSK